MAVKFCPLPHPCLQEGIGHVTHCPNSQIPKLCDQEPVLTLWPPIFTETDSAEETALSTPSKLHSNASSRSS